MGTDFEKLLFEKRMESRNGLRYLLEGRQLNYLIDRVLDPLATPYMFFKWLHSYEELNQYNLQLEMSKIIPRNTPKIVTAVRWRQTGEVRGYVMEKVEGESLFSLIKTERLKNYLSKFGKNKENLKSEIEGIVDKLSKANLNHGDLADRNIILDRRDARPILIDAGYDQPDSEGLVILLRKINDAK